MQTPKCFIDADRRWEADSRDLQPQTQSCCWAGHQSREQGQDHPAGGLGPCPSRTDRQTEEPGRGHQQGLSHNPGQTPDLSVPEPGRSSARSLPSPLPLPPLPSSLLSPSLLLPPPTRSFLLLPPPPFSDRPLQEPSDPRGQQADGTSGHADVPGAWGQRETRRSSSDRK